jgi:hypothetical protein
MNAMLVSGGYPWTVIRGEDRNNCPGALDRASIDMDIQTVRGTHCEEGAIVDESSGNQVAQTLTGSRTEERESWMHFQQSGTSLRRMSHPANRFYLHRGNDGWQTRLKVRMFGRFSAQRNFA